MTTYEIVAQRILDRLNEAEANNERFHWIKPWTGGARLPESYSTGLKYNGTNLNLSPGEYITYNALSDYKKKLPTEESKKIKIKKGCHMVPVFFFTKSDKKDADGNVITRTLDDGTTMAEQYFVLKYYQAFDIADIEGLPSKYPAEKYEYTPTEHTELLDKYIAAFARAEQLTIDITPDSSRCFYRPDAHMVRVAEKSAFTSQYSYYSAICHELIHSTSKGLGRQLGDAFGSEQYSKEELVAQIGSCMLCNIFGIVDDNTDAITENDIAYIQGWSSFVKESKAAEITRSSCQAGKAAQYFIEVAERQLTLEHQEFISIAPHNKDEER